MEPGFQRAMVPRYHTVLVRPEPPGQFTARAVEFPEIQATANTEQEAIEQIKQKLVEFFSRAYLVSVEVPVAKEDPLLKIAGHAKDDPDFDLYLEEIRRFRQEVDERECSDSSSTPIT